MYTPKYSAEERPEVLLELMRAHSFVVLVTTGASGLMATHLPVVVKGDVLEMHVARPNPQWRELATSAGAMAVFSGPHAYVSPAWYADGATVPTWNYAAVHAHGMASTFEGDRLRRHLEELVAVNESAAGTGWTLAGTPERMLEGLQQGVVGIELKISRLEGKLKMSQNRSEADRLGAIAGLRGTGNAESAAVADWMAQLMG